MSRALKVSVFLSLCSFVSIEQQAFAWGQRGHHSICFAATRLLENADLKKFFEGRGDALAHVCNLPDTSWRNQPDTKPGEWAHFMNVERLGYTTASVPTDLSEICRLHQGKPHPTNPDRGINVAEDLGSALWRAEQFYLLAEAAAQRAVAAQMLPPPTESTTMQKSAALVGGATVFDSNPINEPFNAAVYDMIVAMGLMGHFVGDLSQPYHVTIDFDGWASGHGGIHSYYETQIVNQFGLDLQQKIFDRAQALKAANSKLLCPECTPVEVMKLLSMTSSAEIPAVEALDDLSPPNSASMTNADGLHIPAKRSAASDMAPKFEALIVEQLARSAVVLAHFWDRAISRSNIDFKIYQSYKYPLDVTYIPPSYVEQACGSQL